MKSLLQHIVLTLVLVIPVLPGLAQDRIYRCGNEYTNTVPESKKDSCRLISTGNLTVVPAQRPPTAAPARAAGSTPSVIENPEQRTRDAEARMILETELRKAQERLEQLQRDYNQGAPEKLGPETRNHQKYLDRVAELKSAIERTESDIASLRRELGRLPAPASK